MAKDTVNLKCLDLVKIYGNKPMKLEKIIKKNKLRKIIAVPGGTNPPMIAEISNINPLIINLYVVLT
jgi:hypothetical protein